MGSKKTIFGKNIILTSAAPDDKIIEKPISNEIFMKKKLKNLGFHRKSGILMPISSLPSKYGIGDLGEEAYEFIDFISECGIKCWQVLPLNPTAYGDSPYQSPASYAGNPYFISPKRLCDDGLITKKELSEHKDGSRRVDYGRLFVKRYELLRRAFARFCEKGLSDSEEYKKFLKKKGASLSDYTLFMALKCKYNFASWTTWAADDRDVRTARERKNELKCERKFWEWVQFEFSKEWKALSDYAHEKGILIIGDMPIYVAHDSVDVWQAPEEFLLDESFNPTRVAGCPPDGFSPDGQLWGNPIYNWEKMKNDGFSWWKKRVMAAFELYDILRIDHFRGFAGYYSIPYGDETARFGEWRAAPGIELFREIKSSFPKAKIIAEDLGFITDDVRELLRDTDFPGMKILQFAFYDEESEYLPKNYSTDNCVVYTGSHDSECTRSFVSSLEGEPLKRMKRAVVGKSGKTYTEKLISLALSSRAALAVIPIQDYLELTNEDGRMNTPATAEGNWTFRLSPRYKTPALKAKITKLIKEYKR